MELYKRSARHLLLLLVAFGVYVNTYNHQFVFDDVSAIKDNLDLRTETPLARLFENDFWGTPMQNERSHKSYRPLTVLTFRINYIFSELVAGPYHITNAVLHAIVCVLLAWTIEHAFGCNQSVSFNTALLFALHPVHTEAVAGVVGRAELLSAIFYLLSLSAYAHCARCVETYPANGTHRPMRPARTPKLNLSTLVKLVGVVLLVAVGTLCKEQCATALGMCVVYDLIFTQPIDTAALIDLLIRQRSLRAHKRVGNGEIRNGSANHTVTNDTSSTSETQFVHRARLRAAVSRWAVLIISGVVLLVIRIRVVQAAQLPRFTPFDNPAASSLTPARQLTFNYLLVENFWLLACPSWLVCDWTMGTIPLVGVNDPRNILTLVFWFLLAAAAVTLFRRAVPVWRRSAVRDAEDLESDAKAAHARQALVACACVVVPFVPATNLFFPVGFVVAERVLYTPSIGFCLLVALGYDAACRAASSSHVRLLRSTFVFLLLAFSLKTYVRNADWHDEYSLFLSGVKLNHRNAKLWNNVGHALEGTGNLRDALAYFKQARAVQPDDRGAWQNVARTLAALNDTKGAEEAYHHAINLLPQPRTGVNYTARVAPGDLQAFTALARLVASNGARYDEADALLARVISMRADFSPAYAARGELRMKAGRPEEAAVAFREALRLDPRNADVLYNLGVVEYARQDAATALRYLDEALRIKPSHRLALYNSALIVQETKFLARYADAKRRLERLVAEEPENADAHFQLAMLAGDEMRHEDAEREYRRVLEIDPLYRGALFNLALLFGQHLRRSAEAAPLLTTLLAAYPDHISGNLLMGQLNVNDFKDLDAAERNFQAVLRIEPTNSIAMHHMCIVVVERGNLEEGERCLERVRQVAPGSTDIDVHLQIVRSRLASMQQRRAGANIKSGSPGQQAVPPR